MAVVQRVGIPVEWAVVFSLFLQVMSVPLGAFQRQMIKKSGATHLGRPDWIGSGEVLNPFRLIERAVEAGNRAHITTISRPVELHQSTRTIM